MSPNASAAFAQLRLCLFLHVVELSSNNLDPYKPTTPTGPNFTAKMSQNYVPYDDEETEDKSVGPKKKLQDLFIDISEAPQDVDTLKTDNVLRERYKKKVIPFISRWAQDPRAPNFVHEVLEHEAVVVNHNGDEKLFGQKHKEFLLAIAIPENLDQLAVQLPEGNGRTALHKAIESDKKPPSSPFTSLFCKLMEEGIKGGQLTKKQAADIISKTNSEGETCLHLALMKDLDVAERLIELADDATFMKRRGNGNTPLHDALEFPIEKKSLNKHRYLVPAPNCKTPTLRMPMDKFAEVAQPGDATQPPDCCARCWGIDRKYRKLKERRSRIVCALVRRYPAALAIHNEAGKSPFSHHIMAREEFRRKNPNFNDIMNPGKAAHPQLDIHVPEVLSRTRGSVLTRNTNGVQGGGNQDVGPSSPPLGDAISSNPRSSNAPGHGEQLANVGSPRPPRGSISFGHGSIARTRTLQDLGAQQTKEVDDCSPELPRDWFHLSVEVEELLWETAFCIGGYKEARFCLFPSTPARQGTDAEGKPVSFFPTYSRKHGMLPLPRR